MGLTFQEQGFKANDIIICKSKDGFAGSVLTVGQHYKVENHAGGLMIWSANEWWFGTQGTFELFAPASPLISSLSATTNNTGHKPDTFKESYASAKGRLLLGFHEGRKVQIWSDLYKKWGDCPKPAFLANNSYRLKPVPVIETRTVYGSTGQAWTTTRTHTDTHSMSYDVQDGTLVPRSAYVAKLA